MKDLGWTEDDMPQLKRPKPPKTSTSVSPISRDGIMDSSRTTNILLVILIVMMGWVLYNGVRNDGGSVYVDGKVSVEGSYQGYPLRVRIVD